jgi:hypothetical protein
MFPLVLIVAAIGGVWWLRNRQNQQVRSALDNAEPSGAGTGSGLKPSGSPQSGLQNNLSVIRQLKKYNEVGGIGNFWGFFVGRNGTQWRSETYEPKPVRYKTGNNRNDLAYAGFADLSSSLADDEGFSVDYASPLAPGVVVDTLAVERLPTGKWALTSLMDPSLKPVYNTRSDAFAALLFKV